MSHGGTPVVTSLGKFTVHIDGTLYLPPSGTLTIGLHGSGAELELPSSFPSESDDPALPMSKVVQVSYLFTGAAGPNEPDHIHVSKSDSPFSIFIENHSLIKETATIELYIQYLHSQIR